MLVDGLDAVVDEEDLAAALELAEDRLLMRSSSYSPTKVLDRPAALGGVSMMEMSRMPASAMCSVRGIGVAVRVRRRPFSLSWRSAPSA